MIINLAYIVACVFLILGIKSLNKPTTARRGNSLAAFGVLIAVVAVFFENDLVQSWDTSNWLQNGYVWCFAAIAIGSIIGAIWSKKVKMTGMPELVALYNGFGGLASALVAFSQFLKAIENPANDIISAVAICITIFIGAMAFSGSMLAWGKLSEKNHRTSDCIQGTEFYQSASCIGCCRRIGNLCFTRH